uniref:Prostaglandin reductase 1 n=1 Tax=Myripristis murdjan TaxID=586833 RepID=A0A667WAB4_9TELE
MVVAQVWTLKQHFVGFPKPSDFELKDEQLPEPKHGEVLLEAVFLSVDPYMRFVELRCITHSSLAISEVIQSHNPSFPVGSHVVAMCGWRSHYVCDGTGLTPLLPDWPQDIPLSLALGIIGMPGLTALYGLEEVCQIKKGDTLLVNCAAGAVGSAVGQIAKIKGCTVVGSAGTDAKVAYLKELGFDHAFNYKTVSSLDETLRKAAPNGYDCYFDNVRLATHGDHTCFISGHIYKTVYCPYIHGHVLFKQLRMEGFLVTRWEEKFQEGFQRMMAWVKEGKLTWTEHVTEGFSNMPAAFIGMLRGDNTGKAVVKV